MECPYTNKLNMPSGVYAYTDDWFLSLIDYSFAGWQNVSQNRGASANIATVDPVLISPNSGQTLEWVQVAGNSGNPAPQVQSGWIKRAGIDSSPKYFTEYDPCPSGSVCRVISSAIPAGTTHNYAVKYFDSPSTGHVWCTYVDGSILGTCASAPTMGLDGGAPRAIYSGETSDTVADLGGTVGAPLHMDYLYYIDPSGTTLQVNSTLLQSVLTTGTSRNYFTSKGFSGSLTYINNWTEPHH